jgi:hypothetical protein
VTDNVTKEIRAIHRKVLELDLTLEQIGERVAAHTRAAVKREQAEAARLRRMLRLPEETT